MLQSITKLRIYSLAHRTVANIRWFSDDEKFEKKPKVKREESKEKPDKNVKNQESVKKLNALLGTMPLVSKNEIKLQKPKKKEKPAAPQKVDESREAKIKSVTEKIAVKIGGDVKQTQAELMAKLLGTEGVKHSESMKDLLGALKVEENPKVERKESSDNRNQRSDRGRDYTRADSVRQALGSKRERNFDRRSAAAPPTGVVDLFGAKPLGLFDGVSKVKDQLTTWSKLEKRERRLAVTHPPNNYFEKMILWTDQGRLWKFPIDNEQGWEEEQNVDFSEHVLLEMHLDGWCPSSGPVRHFMELVCVGLAKNHHLSAKEKKDHIFWYRDYFEEKKDLLGELMFMNKTPQLDENQTSQSKLEA